jgi:predicted nucleic acid-binding protein
LKADYVIIDERRGAAVANDLHINTIGLIGVLTAAKKQGLISAVKPLLDEIITLGFYISERFYKKTLLQVNE